MHCVVISYIVFDAFCASSIIGQHCICQTYMNKNRVVRFFDMFSGFFIYTGVRFSDIFFTTKQCAVLTLK